jgi:hypothetical protein
MMIYGTKKRGVFIFLNISILRQKNMVMAHNISASDTDKNIHVVFLKHKETLLRNRKTKKHKEEI